MKSSFLYAATRTPFGRFGGALAAVRPHDLAATALAGLLRRPPSLDPSLIADVFRATPMAPEKTIAMSDVWQSCLRGFDVGPGHDREPTLREAPNWHRTVPEGDNLRRYARDHAPHHSLKRHADQMSPDPAAVPFSPAQRKTSVWPSPPSGPRRQLFGEVAKANPTGSVESVEHRPVLSDTLHLDRLDVVPCGDCAYTQEASFVSRMIVHSPNRSELSAYLYDAVRTPFGRFGGALASVRPDDLGAVVIAALVERGVEGVAVDEVVFGNANGAGEDNRNVGRMATLLAGLPTSVPATSVNRLCGSSLDAAMMASRCVETGDADVVIAGGTESMTRAPWVLPKPTRAFPVGDTAAVSTTLGWRLINPEMPADWTVSLGEANEQLQNKFDISRERQDRFALRSHQRADAAWTSGFYDDITVSVPNVDLIRDEGIRPGTTMEKLAGLKPVFRPEGTITAGNASPLNDGASAVLIGSRQASQTLRREPIARIAGRGAMALDPQMFGYAPVEAANRALARAGIGWNKVGAVELNEAFAIQSLACMDAWDVDPDIVNQAGGAIAIGHPLGASGARILGTLAHVLRRNNKRWGVAAICIGVGQGLAVVLENESVS